MSAARPPSPPLLDIVKPLASPVRVPVRTGHSESVNLQTREPLSADEAREYGIIDEVITTRELAGVPAAAGVA